MHCGWRIGCGIVKARWHLCQALEQALEHFG